MCTAGDGSLGQVRDRSPRRHVGLRVDQSRSSGADRDPTSQGPRTEPVTLVTVPLWAKAR